VDRGDAFARVVGPSHAAANTSITRTAAQPTLRARRRAHRRRTTHRRSSAAFALGGGAARRVAVGAAVRRGQPNRHSEPVRQDQRAAPGGSDGDAAVPAAQLVGQRAPQCREQP